MLDIKRLQYLEAIYKYKNFTRTSEALFISQPALSAAINAMESEYGVSLITRTSKRVSFTVEGEQFMLYARRILNEHRAAEQFLAECSFSISQTLHLGISPTLSERLLPKLYSDFFPQWPNAKIHIDENSMNNHVKKIQNELLDLSFNIIPDEAQQNGLDVLPIMTSEICALMQPEHPLTKYNHLPISRLEKEPLAMLDENAGVRILLTKAFEEKGIIPNICSTHAQISCMVNMVRFGNYIGFINADPIHPSANYSDLSVVLFEEPLRFEAGFIFKKGKRLSKVATALIAYTKDILTNSDPLNFKGFGKI